MHQLIIRDEQMSVLEEDTLHRWLCECIRSAYPHAAAGQDGKALRSLVAAAVRSAGERGFKTDSDLAAYVRTAFLLGPGFDVDPQFPWVERILESRRLCQPGERAWALETAAMRHAARIRDGLSGVPA